MIYYYLIFCIISIVTVILQSSFGAIFPEWRAFPDVVLLVTVYSSFTYGKLFGQTVGFVGGIVEDIIGLVPGLHMLVRSTIGFLIGFTAAWRETTSLILPILLTLVALAMRFILLLIIATLFSLEATIGSLLSISYLYEVILTIVCAPLIFTLLALIPQYIPPENR